MYKRELNAIKVSVLLIVIGVLLLTSLSSQINSQNSNGMQTVNTSASPSPTYNVSFHESGLAKGVSWSVSLFGSHSSTTPYVNFTGISNNVTRSFTVSSPVFSSYQYIPTPATGTVYVHNKNVAVPISYYNQTTSVPVKGFDLNFTINNFPSVLPGISWSWKATVTGDSVAYGPVTSSSSTTNQITYFSGLANGTYSYKISPAYGTSVTPATGQVSLNGKNTTVDLSVSLQSAYILRFNESGLPSGQKFTVSLQDAPTGGSLYSNTNYTFTSAGTYVDFQVINQTYDYTVSSPTGYTAYPSYGTATVLGSPLNLTVKFTTSSKSYPVEFKITNPLANAQEVQWSWGVTINGTFYGNSHNDTLQGISLSPGSYAYVTSWSGIALSPMEGNFNIVNNSTTVFLKSVPTWSMKFAVSNLASSPYGYPSFTLQAVMNLPGSVGGSTVVASMSSTAGVAKIPALPNGSYYYTLSSSNSYYTLSPTSGSFTIKGANQSVGLKATVQNLYSIQFTESGLLSYSGVSWGVVVDNGFYYNDSTPIPGGGLSHVSAPNAVVISLPQGSYYVQAFVIDSGGNYHFMAPVHIQVGSSTHSYNMQFVTATNSPGISLPTGYVIAIGVVVAAAIGGTTVFLMRRRKVQGP